MREMLNIMKSCRKLMIGSTVIFDLMNAYFNFCISNSLFFPPRTGMLSRDCDFIIQGGPRKTAHGFLCYNFAYAQSIFIIFGTYTL